MAIGAGTRALVFILRWFWWRINAWSEVAAMSAAATSSLLLQSRLAAGAVHLLRGFDPSLPEGPLNAADPHGFAWLMLLTTSFTTVCWLAVTLLTPPEPEQTLRAFYRKVRPAEQGWARIARLEKLRSPQNLKWSLCDWAAGCAMIYLALFGLGKIIFGHGMTGFLMLAGAAALLRFLFWDLKRHDWEALD